MFINLISYIFFYLKKQHKAHTYSQLPLYPLLLSPTIMPSTTIHFTPEFILACQRLWLDGRDNSSNVQEGQYPDFMTFFSDIKIPKNTEKSSLPELESLPFNPEKCEARIEKHGFAIQCSRNPFNGGCLCKTHQNTFDKLPEGKDIPYGRYNKERPDFTLDKGNPIKWGEKKARGKSTTKEEVSSKPKMGEMRDFLSSRVPTEDFRHLKKKELFDLYTSVKNKEISSPSTSSDSSPKSTQASPHETLQSDSPITSQENILNDSQTDTHQEVEDDGTGTGLHLSPRLPKTVSEYKTLFDELGIDYSSIRGLRGFKMAHQDYIKSKEEEEEQTQPMSDDDDDELQEDKSSYQEMDFEGVSYLEEEDSGKIYNLKHQHVGQWNEDVDDIIWVSDEFKQTHESSRQ